jgi:mevalonate kinase
MMASSPAKVILFGEHAVVYGQPAIAVPVSALRAYAEVEETGELFRIVARDLNDKQIGFDIDDPLAQVTRLTLDRIAKPIPQVRITIKSDIPIASGLGSGAAISTAIVRALASYYEVNLSNESINEIVYEVEKIHHGTPSGIDNTVIVYEQAVYFVRDKLIETIANAKPFTLLVADTGQSALTKIAVGDLRQLYEADTVAIKPLIANIGRLVDKAREAMKQGEILQIGQLMLENHTLLQKLTVSSPELDALVEAAMRAEALGAKLSGGGRGGNMIALVTEETKANVMQALKDAGAVQVFETIVEAS